MEFDDVSQTTDAEDIDESNRKYWEQVFNESQNIVERQVIGVENKRETILGFVRYHFLFLGFVFTIANFGLDGMISFERWLIALLCAPSLIGIIISAHGHRSLGSYNIGGSYRFFVRVNEQEDDYTRSLKELSREYLAMTDKNRKIMRNHDKYRFLNMFLLFIGFGMLIGVIVF